MGITRETAQTIIGTAFAKGREPGFLPLSAIVPDAGGHPRAFSREDGASPGRCKIAIGKAHGSIKHGVTGDTAENDVTCAPAGIEAVGPTVEP